MFIISIIAVYIFIYAILWIIAKIKGMSTTEFIKANYPILLFLSGLIYVIIAAIYCIYPSDTDHTMDIFSISTFGISLMITGHGQLSKEKEEITKSNDKITRLNDPLVKKETENKELQAKINDLTQENNELKKLLEEKSKAYDKLVDKILDSQKEVCVLSKIAKKIKKWEE